MRGRRGNSHADRAQVEAQHHDQIEDHVEHARRGKEGQRADGISRGAQHCRTVVIQNVGDRAAEVRAHIGHGLRHDDLLGPHQRKKRTGKENADHGRPHAADQRGQHRGMYRTGNVVVLSRAHVVGHGNARADRQTDEQIDQQGDQCAAGANGGQSRLTLLGRASSPAADHDDVCRVEQELQNARGDQGKHESCQLRQDRTLRIVTKSLLRTWDCHSLLTPLQGKTGLPWEAPFPRATPEDCRSAHKGSRLATSLRGGSLRFRHQK